MINLHYICSKYLLEHLSLILMGRETKGGRNHITFVELARRQIAQHSAHINNNVRAGLPAFRCFNKSKSTVDQFRQCKGTTIIMRLKENNHVTP